MMRSSFTRCLLASLGLHLSVLMPCAAFGLAHPPVTDVERGAGVFQVVYSATPVRAAAEGMRAPTARPVPAAAEPSTPGAYIAHASVGIHNPAPRYPALARRLGWEGTVLLRVEVAPDGRPTSVRVASSSGIAVLDEAAQAAIRRWQFVPAVRGQRAVFARVEVPVVFKLTEGGSEDARTLGVDRGVWGPRQPASSRRWRGAGAGGGPVR